MELEDGTEGGRLGWLIRTSRGAQGVDQLIGQLV